MNSKLNWLHLSDIHFSQKTEWRDGTARDALLEYLDEIFKSDNSIRPDLIFCTGDLAFGEIGTDPLTQQYVEIAKFFDSLRSICGKSDNPLPKERLFVVPGNHDINRKSINIDAQESLIGKAKEARKHSSVINQRVADLSPEFIDNIKRLNEYVGFTKTHLPHQYDNNGRCCYTNEIVINGIIVCITGFNSAWSCAGPEDDRHLWLAADWQFNNAKKNSKDTNLRIGLIHHPIDNFNVEDRDIATRRVTNDFHFWLHGHSHNAWVTPTPSNITIAAGAVCAEDNEEFGINLTCLDLIKSTGIAHLHSFSVKDSGWAIKPIPGKAPKAEWKFDIPETQHNQKLLAAATVSTATSQVLPLSAKYDTANKVFNLPFREKGEQVIGRNDALRQLRCQLNEGKPTSVGHAASFEGLGGLGKTQLAVEYAYRFREEYTNGVIWINADQNIDAQLTNIAVLANWIAPETEHKLKLDVALHRLRSFSDCLIIFDNVDDFAAIEEYLPLPIATPHILVTSRIPLPGFTPIQLDPLSEPQSLKLLLQEASRQITAETEMDAACDIVKQLDGLPLALELAGGYLRHRSSMTFSKYRDRLLDEPLDTLSKSTFASFTKHDADLFKTLKIEEDIIQEEPLLEDILQLLTWSGPASMGLKSLSTLLGIEEIKLSGALAFGTQLKLLQNNNDDRYALHRLVREVRRNENPLDSSGEWANDTCKRLGDWLEDMREDFHALPHFESEIDHLIAWRSNVEQHIPAHACRLTWLQAYPAYHRGLYRECLKIISKAEDIYNSAGLTDLTLRANLDSDLGSTYGFLGNYSKSLEYLKRGLELREPHLGKFHRDTAMSYSNIGRTLDVLYNHEEALEYEEVALQIRQAVFGENHRDTAMSYNNIGTTYGSLEDHQKSLEYQQKALDINQTVLGENHPDTAGSYSSIGNTYRKLGNNNESIEYIEKALTIYREVLGENHPHIATPYSTLGATYSKLNDQQMALDCAKKALNIRVAALGEYHPFTAISFGNVGSAYAAKGKNQAALQHLEKALSIYKSVFGQEHPETIKSYLNLSNCHCNMGRFDIAFKYLQTGKKLAQKSLPNAHILLQEFDDAITKVSKKYMRPGFRHQKKKSGKKKRK